MTLTEARKILGLGPDEDPRPHLEGFNAVRGRIAEMVRTAPNDEIAQRYQSELVEFDRALAAVREYLEALGLVAKAADLPVAEAPPVVTVEPGNAATQKEYRIFAPENLVETPIGPKVPATPEPEDDFNDGTTGISLRVICFLLILLACIGFGGWTYLKIEEDRFLKNQARIVFLERQGAVFIENRRWPEAAKAFDEIEALDPDSDLVKIGRRSIEAGMIEEQNQFIGYWKGEALAAFEASRWDDSEKAAREVLNKYPDEEEILALMEKIALAKVKEQRRAALDEVRERIEERKFDEAISGARELVADDTEDQDAKALLEEALAAKEKADADMARARLLLAKALAKDTGQYDEEALEWLREAVALAPDDDTIQASYEKMAAYTRTIRVPGDFETIQDALASSRDRDRIVIGEGTWVGPFIVNAAVEMEGDSGKTILECSAEEGSVISISPGVERARVSGMTLRHLSFDAGKDRFSLALVRNAKADFSDCVFEQGSGHGLAVMEGGHAKVIRCRFTENGWNGIAVFGAGSLLEAEGNILKGNFQNGIESWEDAAVILTKNDCQGNTRNGIHIENNAASATISENKLTANREYGLVISSAGSGQVTENLIQKNFLGGMVVKARAAEVIIKKNGIRSNAGPGLILEEGLQESGYQLNTVSANKGGEILDGIDFSE